MVKRNYGEETKCLGCIIRMDEWSIKKMGKGWDEWRIKKIGKTILSISN